MSESFNQTKTEFFEAMSALQKSIRRGNEWNAYYFASVMENFNAKTLWNRIKVITSEDIGPSNPSLPATIDTLERWYWEAIGRGDSGGRLHLVNAILLLSRSPKNRDCDNLLITLDCKMMAGWKQETPDYALDKHTLRGKKMGRGFDHFFEEGTYCENDQSNPEWKEEAPKQLKEKGFPVEWKMHKLLKYKNNKQQTLSDF